jgi:hypothetical protein
LDWQLSKNGYWRTGRLKKEFNDQSVDFSLRVVPKL